MFWTIVTSFIAGSAFQSLLLSDKPWLNWPVLIVNAGYVAFWLWQGS